MLLRNSWIYFLFLLGLSTCIDPVDLKIEQQPDQLVVEGLITNESTQAPIKLSYTQSYNQDPKFSARKLINANVYLTDQNNNIYSYFEEKPGSYLPESFSGKVGNTYTLHIITKEGKEYQSEPEKLLPVSDIDYVDGEVRSRKVIDKSGFEVIENLYQTFVNTSDPAEVDNFYMWRWKGTYQVVAQPQDHMILDARGNYIPAPLPCCAVCWINTGYQNIIVRNDALINGNKIIKQPITPLPVIAQTFNNKYYFEVKQYSLTPKSFNFWRLVTNQVTGVGSIQDPPPAIIPGNIFNVNDKNEVVAGFFGASAVSKKAIFFYPQDIPFTVPEFNFPNDCRVIENSTTLQPDFW